MWGCSELPGTCILHVFYFSRSIKIAMSFNGKWFAFDIQQHIVMCCLITCFNANKVHAKWIQYKTHLKEYRDDDDLQYHGVFGTTDPLNCLFYPRESACFFPLVYIPTIIGKVYGSLTKCLIFFGLLVKLVQPMQNWNGFSLWTLLDASEMRPSVGRELVNWPCCKETTSCKWV